MSHPRTDALFRHPELDAQQLVRTHELRRVEVAHDPAVSFGLPVPRAMGLAHPQVQQPRRRGQPEVLAVAGLPPDLSGPRLLVSAQTLVYEVDPLEWLRWLFTNAGWTIALARSHPGPDGPRYEVGAMREHDGGVLVRRTMAVRGGPRLVRCDAEATMAQWPAWHDALWASLQGFDLGAPQRGSVEALVAWDGPLLSFGLPGSWDCQGVPSDDTEGAAWAAMPDRDVQRGATLAIQVQALAPGQGAVARRRRMFEELRRETAAAGGSLSGFLEASRPELKAHVPGWVGQWQALGQCSAGDVVVVVVQREEHGAAMDVVLTAPAAGTDHIDWMRATRALDIVIATSSLGREQEVA
ncbi:MAG: hypothetical protein ACE37F_00890 [Nannocystaceae bacterium]|nr:hypothetical protein [bacterium]